jgi:hypothetical protein
MCVCVCVCVCMYSIYSNNLRCWSGLRELFHLPPLLSQIFIVLENDKYELVGRVCYDTRFCDRLPVRDGNIVNRREKLTIWRLTSGNKNVPKDFPANSCQVFNWYW